MARACCAPMLLLFLAAISVARCAPGLPGPAASISAPAPSETAAGNVATPGTSLPVALPAASIKQAISLAGAVVSGVLTINNAPTNYYDYTKGFVSAGYGNSSPNKPTSVPVTDIAAKREFGFLNGSIIDTDLQTNGIIKVYISTPNPWPVSVITLTTDAFKDAASVTVLDNADKGAHSLKGKTRARMGKRDVVACTWRQHHCHPHLPCSGVCCQGVNFAPNTTVCRAANGDCDVAEFCTGDSGDCPADTFKPSNTACRAAAGACDLPASCTGNNPACPPNKFKPNSITCRAATGDCDVAEFCTGNSVDCPADTFKPNSAECRAAAGACDLPASCTGNNPACPPNKFKPNSITCRAATGDCDVAEFCTGNSVDCPADTFKPNSAECRAAGGDCDVAEFCTGDGVDCPADTFKPNSTECRAANGDCDVAEFCTGDSSACPAETFQPSTFKCRDAVDDCDVAEYCTGDNTDCPDDTKAEDGTTCSLPPLLYRSKEYHRRKHCYTACKSGECTVFPGGEVDKCSKYFKPADN